MARGSRVTASAIVAAGLQAVRLPTVNIMDRGHAKDGHWGHGALCRDCIMALLKPFSRINV